MNNSIINGIALLLIFCIVFCKREQPDSNQELPGLLKSIAGPHKWTGIEIKTGYYKRFHNDTVYPVSFECRIIVKDADWIIFPHTPHLSTDTLFYRCINNAERTVMFTSQYQDMYSWCYDTLIYHFVTHAIVFKERSRLTPFDPEKYVVVSAN